MTYIFTAEQLAGIIQYNLKTDDPLVLENVAFIAELAYQDSKNDMREHTDQPWPEHLADTHFETYDNLYLTDNHVWASIEYDSVVDDYLTYVTYTSVIEHIDNID